MNPSWKGCVILTPPTLVRLQEFALLRTELMDNFLAKPSQKTLKKAWFNGKTFPLCPELGRNIGGLVYYRILPNLVRSRLEAAMQGAIIYGPAKEQAKNRHRGLISIRYAVMVEGSACF